MHAPHYPFDAMDDIKPPPDAIRGRAALCGLSTNDNNIVLS
jgi:hypothetical protein